MINSSLGATLLFVCFFLKYLHLCSSAQKNELLTILSMVWLMHSQNRLPYLSWMHFPLSVWNQHLFTCSLSKRLHSPWGQNPPSPSTQRTCTKVFLNLNSKLASYKIRTFHQGTNAQSDCFAQCHQMQKDWSRLLPLQQTCLNFPSPEHCQSLSNQEIKTPAL